MGKGKSVLELATALVKQKDSDKEIARITKEVKANENNWRGDIFKADTAAEEAAERLEALQSSTGTSAQQLLEATRAAELAAKNLEALNELANIRFGKKLD